MGSFSPEYRGHLAGNGQMKRVLVSGAVLDQGAGGVRRHNQELLPRLAKLLSEAGGELAILAPEHGLSFDAGTDARLIPTNIPSGSPALRFMYESKATLAELRAAARRNQPFDVLHTAHLPMSRVHKAVEQTVRRTHTIHDLRVLDPRESTGLRRVLGMSLVKRALRKAERIFTVSESVRDQLIERGLITENRCVVVPNAGDHLGIIKRCPNEQAPLLHVGHVEPRKNLELLIHALALDPGLPRLQLAGAVKRDWDQKLIQLAQQLNVSDRLELLGPVTETQLLELYSNAACVVIPSRLEGFGIGVLEAQLARIPLAISRAGALPEVAGRETPNFDPNNAKQCVSAIQTALVASDESLEQAEERARRFTWDESAKLFYRALLGDPPANN
ncbi:MAG: glycosyltransferase involved in cell wall biosynthesis [Planctomycetota bacterium]|jgi:glycosyltransferase involved in cell wall biosynthesis